MPQGSGLTTPGKRANERLMYPIIRFAHQVLKYRNAPRLAPGEVHVSHHICWPWDLDPWMELNNGRTLTIFDLGRIPLAQRSGLVDMLRREKWGLTVAGSVVRYRRRVQVFDKVEMRSRLLSWDKRFLYLEQTMWKSNGDCANHAVYRSAVTDRNGIVTTDRVTQALGIPDAPLPMPEWVSDWIAAEDKRPWPPMLDSFE